MSGQAPALLTASEPSSSHKGRLFGLARSAAFEPGLSVVGRPAHSDLSGAVWTQAMKH